MYNQVLLEVSEKYVALEDVAPDTKVFSLENDTAECEFVSSHCHMLSDTGKSLSPKRC